MPYANLPKDLWKSMETCVASVRAKGKVKNPYAICYTSITRNQQVRKKIKSLKK